MSTSAALAAFVIGSAVLAGAPASPAQHRELVRRGRLALMHAYDGDALRGFDYTRRAALDARQLAAAGIISLSRADGELGTDAGRLAGPIDLPAGRFTARLRLNRDQGGGGARVLLGGATAIAAGAAGAPLAFDLPLDGSVSIAVSDDAVAAATQAIDLTADSIVPKGSRTAIDVHAVEPIAGRSGAYLVYADANTYPEHGVFWTKGTRAGTVFLAPAGASTLILTLHVGPEGGAVRVTVDGQDRSVTLAADHSQQIRVALRPSTRLVPVVVQAPGAFRPSDHEAGSTDHRSLGCQVHLELQ